MMKKRWSKDIYIDIKIGAVPLISLSKSRVGGNDSCDSYSCSNNAV